MPASFYLVMQADHGHLPDMKIRLLAVLLLGCPFAFGEENTPKEPVKTRIIPPTSDREKPRAVVLSADEGPTWDLAVEAAIPASVKALGEPAMFPFPNGIQMAVTATSEKAQAHVNQGMNHVHGGWEFEASRHFAAAMRADPECLLAHWGMLLSMLTPSPETDPARVAVTSRLLDLVEKGNGSELERGFAYSLIKYIEVGPVGAANAFQKVATNFPNDMQATIFAALFGRGGYDELGSATPAQETAEKSLLALTEKFPDSPVPINALLTIRAEAPDLSPWLALATRLTQMSPDYPPYQHLLGHYRWRCGQHSQAAAAFSSASVLYQAWMKQNNASIADCPEWGRAECYRIVSLTSKGDFDTASTAARQLAATPIPKDRPTSPGARLLMWDAKTLPARILLYRDLPTEALKTLPKPSENEQLRKHSLSHLWIDGLRLSLEVMRQIEARNLVAAREVATVLSQLGDGLSKTKAAATASGERSSWNRAFRGLEVLSSDLRGQLAAAGPKGTAGTAYNWFASAADRQHPAPMMYPPMILTPMANRIGHFYLTAGQPTEAIDAFERALVAFPNDITSLRGLKSAFEAAKLPDRALKIEEKIQALRAQ
jgi:tetratricopeptide (TPR) repeat protein